ncbi:hypothetical protein COY90_02615 [Candidatus Roizmanbacteria bacterium CG_4_10_14_0_8_um_filter_39_9]|uniref:Uncharacterized protein n=1 Tax=Candidatus Roizmanbacteria bacterium CG_4_10_14_0_8_um_filter_39_9 TaxID=1974829 RepID=A0A2M7QDS9_9BACT|nr:MAG: hypothetical protein COY90_02615 [Candidatus Roizmanbacteria bacterium CG_4_10_14_0_8_um_filter_39_9]
MNKGSFWDDTFEKALEAGQSMAKSSAKQIKQTFSPLQMIKNALGGGESNPQSPMESKMKEMQGKKEMGNTPLDFSKLQEKYQNQDKAKTDMLRQRLFQMVKGGDEKIMMEKKQKEEEEKRRIAYEEHERKRNKQDQQRMMQQSGNEPQGKERQSVLAPKKKKRAQNPSPIEIKPSTGKQ